MGRKIEDLTGKRFGRLVVVERTKNRGKHAAWKCDCDCGNTAEISSTNLISGHTTSCGCFRKELGAKTAKNLKGIRFGRLLVIKDSGKRSHSFVVWQCQCDCGREVQVSSHALLRGQLSCGCLRNENNSRRRLKEIALEPEKGTQIRSIKPHRKPRKNNKSGTIGVSWDVRRQKWRAKISLKGNDIFLGYFFNKQDAINTRKAAEEKYFKPILEKYRKKV